MTSFADLHFSVWKWRRKNIQVSEKNPSFEVWKKNVILKNMMENSSDSFLLETHEAEQRAWKLSDPSFSCSAAAAAAVVKAVVVLLLLLLPQLLPLAMSVAPTHAPPPPPPTSTADCLSHTLSLTKSLFFSFAALQHKTSFQVRW